MKKPVHKSSGHKPPSPPRKPATTGAAPDQPPKPATPPIIKDAGPESHSVQEAPITEGTPEPVIEEKPIEEASPIVDDGKVPDLIMLPGEVKRIELKGHSAGKLVGVIPETLSSSDNHTIQVYDKGDGTGELCAVGIEGGSATISATDDQGNEACLNVSIGTRIDRLEIAVIGDPPA